MSCKIDKYKNDLTKKIFKMYNFWYARALKSDFCAKLTLSKMDTFKKINLSRQTGLNDTVVQILSISRLVQDSSKVSVK